MFHSGELLGKKGSDLSNVWVAGTMGSRRLTKTAILKYNLARLCLAIQNTSKKLPLPAQSTLLRGVVRIEEKQTSFLYIDALDTKTRLITMNALAKQEQEREKQLQSRRKRLQQSATAKNDNVNGMAIADDNYEANLTGKGVRDKQLLQQTSTPTSSLSASTFYTNTLGSLGPVIIPNIGSLKHLNKLFEQEGFNIEELEAVHLEQFRHLKTPLVDVGDGNNDVGTTSPSSTAIAAREANTNFPPIQLGNLVNLADMHLDLLQLESNLQGGGDGDSRNMNNAIQQKDFFDEFLFQGADLPDLPDLSDLSNISNLATMNDLTNFTEMQKHQKIQKFPEMSDFTSLDSFEALFLTDGIHFDLQSISKEPHFQEMFFGVKPDEKKKEKENVSEQGRDISEEMDDEERKEAQNHENPSPDSHTETIDHLSNLDNFIENTNIDTHIISTSDKNELNSLSHLEIDQNFDHNLGFNMNLPTSNTLLELSNFSNITNISNLDQILQSTNMDLKNLQSLLMTKAEAEAEAEAEAAIAKLQAETTGVDQSERSMQQLLSNNSHFKESIDETGAITIHLDSDSDIDHEMDVDVDVGNMTSTSTSTSTTTYPSPSRFPRDSENIVNFGIQQDSTSTISSSSMTDPASYLDLQEPYKANDPRYSYLKSYRRERFRDKLRAQGILTLGANGNVITDAGTKEKLQFDKNIEVSDADIARNLSNIHNFTRNRILDSALALQLHAPPMNPYPNSIGIREDYQIQEKQREKREKEERERERDRKKRQGYRQREEISQGGVTNIADLADISNILPYVELQSSLPPMQPSILTTNNQPLVTIRNFHTSDSSFNLKERRSRSSIKQQIQAGVESEIKQSNTNSSSYDDYDQPSDSQVYYNPQLRPLLTSGCDRWSEIETLLSTKHMKEYQQVRTGINTNTTKKSEKKKSHRTDINDTNYGSEAEDNNDMDTENDDDDGDDENTDNEIDLDVIDNNIANNIKKYNNNILLKQRRLHALASEHARSFSISDPTTAGNDDITLDILDNTDSHQSIVSTYWVEYANQQELLRSNTHIPSIVIPPIIPSAVESTISSLASFSSHPLRIYPFSSLPSDDILSHYNAIRGKPLIESITDASHSIFGISSFISGIKGTSQGLITTLAPVYLFSKELYTLAFTTRSSADCLESVESYAHVHMKENTWESIDEMMIEKSKMLQRESVLDAVGTDVVDEVDATHVADSHDSYDIHGIHDIHDISDIHNTNHALGERIELSDVGISSSFLGTGENNATTTGGYDIGDLDALMSLHDISDLQNLNMSGVNDMNMNFNIGEIEVGRALQHQMPTDRLGFGLDLDPILNQGNKAQGTDMMNDVMNMMNTSTTSYSDFMNMIEIDESFQKQLDTEMMKNQKVTSVISHKTDTIGTNTDTSVDTDIGIDIGIHDTTITATDLDYSTIDGHLQSDKITFFQPSVGKSEYEHEHGQDHDLTDIDIQVESDILLEKLSASLPSSCLPLQQYQPTGTMENQGEAGSFDFHHIGSSGLLLFTILYRAFQTADIDYVSQLLEQQQQQQHGVDGIDDIDDIDDIGDINPINTTLNTNINTITTTNSTFQFMKRLSSTFPVHTLYKILNYNDYNKLIQGEDRDNNHDAFSLVDDAIFENIFHFIQGSKALTEAGMSKSRRNTQAHSQSQPQSQPQEDSCNDIDDANTDTEIEANTETDHNELSSPILVLDYSKALEYEAFYQLDRQNKLNVLKKQRQIDEKRRYITLLETKMNLIQEQMGQLVDIAKKRTATSLKFNNNINNTLGTNSKSSSSSPSSLSSSPEIEDIDLTNEELQQAHNLRSIIQRLQLQITENQQRIPLLQQSLEYEMQKYKTSQKTFSSTAICERLSLYDVSNSFVQLLHLQNLNIIKVIQSSPFSPIHIVKGIYWHRLATIQKSKASNSNNQRLNHVSDIDQRSSSLSQKPIKRGISRQISTQSPQHTQLQLQKKKRTNVEVVDSDIGVDSDVDIDVGIISNSSINILESPLKKRKSDS